MSEGAPSGITPRDLEAEANGRTRRRRRTVAFGVILALVVAIVIGQLTFGLVTRVIDATGWTCGSGWQRMNDDDLADKRIVRWGTPEAREQGFDPGDFADLPPGLAQPTLTTAADPGDGYDPSLYPLDGGVVVQSEGYYDNTWVMADAVTGDPLWGVVSSTSGFGTVAGYFTLMSSREDGRTDLTSFDARTGEELSCVRLDGEILTVDEVGEGDLVIGLSAAGDGESGYRMLRLDPTNGDIAWDEPSPTYPATVHAAGDLIVLSSHAPGHLVTSWVAESYDEIRVVGIDPATGEDVWEHAATQGQVAAVGVVALPDGTTGTLALDIPDEQAWEGATGEYLLLDEAGAELWRTPADYGRDDVVSWDAGGVVVILEDYRPVGIDLATGERLWRAEGSGDESDVDVLNGAVVLGGQRVEEDGEARFVTHVIDPATGALTVHDAPLHSFQATDSYVLTTTAHTQIVIPLEQ